MTDHVYIVTHKNMDLPKIHGYIPLAVGAVGKEFPEHYRRDDVGDNISSQNNEYCELTGLYWIWKNDNSNNVGLVHYRRYFVKIKKTVKFMGRYVFISKRNKYSILTVDELNALLEENDFLVKISPKKRETNGVHFKTFLGNTIWEELKESIDSVCPEYKKDFVALEKAKTHLNCNMFFGKKENLDKYAEWLFRILNNVDSLHNSRFGKTYDNREMGYLSEFLFQVWLDHNDMKYFVVPVVNTGDSYAMDGVLNLYEVVKFVCVKSYNHIFSRNKERRGL